MRRVAVATCLGLGAARCAFLLNTDTFASGTGTADAEPMDGQAHETPGATDAGADVQKAVQDAACSSRYKQMVLGLPGLVSYWRLDDVPGSGIARDIAGGGFDLTYANATLGQPSLLASDPGDEAIALDGSGFAYAVITGDAGVGLNLTQNMTLGAIVQPRGVGGKYQIIAVAGSYWIQVDDGGIEVGILPPGNPETTNPLVLDTDGGLVDDAVSYVVGTYDGTTLRAYVNGAPIGALSVDASLAFVGGQQPPAELRLGTWDGYTNFFTGILDEAFVVNGVLDAGELAALYRAGTTACPDGD
jgi:hypothetical protein